MGHRVRRKSVATFAKVARMLAKGMTPVQIAAKVGVTDRRVRQIRQYITSKGYAPRNGRARSVHA